MEHRHCFPYPSLGVQAERLPCPGVGCCAPREVARASGCGDLLRLATRSWSDGGRVLLAITIDHHKPKGLWGSEACRRAKTHAFLEMNRGVNIHVVFFPCFAVKCGVARIVLPYLPVEQVESMMINDGLWWIPVIFSWVCNPRCKCSLPLSLRRSLRNLDEPQRNTMPMPLLYCLRV